MSVINKMLNDLDERKDTSEVSEEVAFLQPVSKPKKKWLMVVLGSVLFGLVVVGGSYYFYPQLLALTGQKPLKTPKVPTTEEIRQRMNQVAREKAAAQAAAAAQKNDAASTEKGATDQPELIKLDASGQAAQAQRPSTLSVVSVKDGVQNQAPQTQVQRAKTQPVSSTDTKVAPSLEAKADVGAGAGSSTKQGDEQAQESLKRAKPTEAEKPVGKSKMQVSKVKLSPAQRADKAYGEAVDLAKKGNITEAIGKYEQALRFNPKHQEARSELAAMYYGRGDSARALEVLDQGLMLQADNVQWALLAAKIHYKRTDYAAAEHYLTLPVVTYDHIEYVALRATNAFKLKDFTQALDAYRRLTVADAGNGRWWLGLGTALEATGQEAEAVKAYRKSLALSNISNSSRKFALSRIERLAN